ncbi:MAG: phosphoglycerate dehydrogenase [Acidobacteria bacterium]|nr:phosphoglycerate dehydrogenase [Acidobacteriota bacterium]
MKIVIPDPLPAAAVSLLEAEGWIVDTRTGRSAAQLRADLSDADALIVRSATTVTAELIAAAPRLRVVARAGAGVDNVDIEAASDRGILVLNAPGANSVSVAEHVFALMLSSARSVALADAQMKAGRWCKKSLRGAELRGKTLGVVGLGRIGREVVRRALAFDMAVVAHDPFIASQVADDLGIELLALEALAERADFITLHLPSTDSTRGLLNRALLARCRPGTRVINTARGDLLDEAALVEAISEGRIAGAGLDVFRQEPPADTTLTGLPQVIATPHIAGATAEAQQLVGLAAATGIREYLQTGFARNAVNYPSIAPDELRGLRPYLVLAERLGSLLAQLAHGRIAGVGLRYYGQLADQPHEMLVSATLVGLLGQVLSQEVTLVNARAAAEQRGLEVVEARSSRPRNFTSLVSLKLHTSDGELWAEGALFEPEQPRLVRLDGVEVEAPLEGTLIVIRNRDQPGVIGEVGSILGRHGINIATFALGRGAGGAVGVVRVGPGGREGTPLEPDVTGEVLDEIRGIAAVDAAGLIRL